MRERTVDFSDINRRSMALLSAGRPNSQYLYDIANASLKESRSTATDEICAFFEKSVDFDNANKHYKRCLSLIERAKDNEVLSARLESKFVNEIIPCIENLNGLKESLDRYALNESFVNETLESIKEYKICDRIVTNSEKLNKRFDFNGYMKENYAKPLDETVSFFCSMIDTYDIPPYAKMNIVFEEMNYQLQKNSVKYDRKDLVTSVTEYFLFRESNIKKEDYEGYKNVLSENMTISDSDLSDVSYFVESEYRTRSNPDSMDIIKEALYSSTEDVEKLLNDFKTDPDKNESKLKATINKFFTKDPESILEGTPDLLSVIRTCIIFTTFAIPGVGAIVGIISLLVSKYISMNLNRKQIDKVIASFEKELDKVDNKLNSDKISDAKYDELSKYRDSIDAAIDKFTQYKDDLYTDENIKDALGIASNSESAVISLSEFKIFKFQNLITAAIEIDRFLKRKGNKAVEKITDVAKKIFKPNKIRKWFKESYNGEDIYEYITESQSVDVCVYGFEVENVTSDLHESCTALCKEINDNVIGNKDIRAYYTVRGNVFEVHIADNHYINLTEQELELSNSTFMEEDSYFLSTLKNIEECFIKIDSSNATNLVDDIRESNITVDDMVAIIESNNYSNIIPEEEIQEMVSEYKKNTFDYIGFAELDKAMDAKKDIVFDPSLIGDSACIIRDIIEASNQSAQGKNNTTKRSNVPTTSKRPNNLPNRNTSSQGDSIASKLDKGLTTAKLAIKDLQTKAKNLSAKEQEASKMLDATVGHYYTAAKRFVTNDRREAIIKGSMIPSFSKCIKYAIALAGTGILAHSIVVPVILAFGALAISKKNNKKERALMLDEIEIELKIVEKELNIAEGNNNVRKMRELMQLQKKLQRERQRIRYNIKVGQDMPNSGGDE